MEWRLTDEDVPYVSTLAFHRDRERVRHLEEKWSQPRLHKAEEFLRHTATEVPTWSDLGCGDGGLLSLAQDAFVQAWGYDFTPANVDGWKERGVCAYAMDAFGKDQDRVRLGEAVSLTEVLEHLARPHDVLAWVRQSSKYLVCSSPWNEYPGHSSPEHAWAWDVEGYANLIHGAGWSITRHEQVGLFQVVLAH